MPEDLAPGVLVQLVGEDRLLAVAETTFEPGQPDRLFFKPVCVLQVKAGGN
jgi:hypothetical protein